MSSKTAEGYDFLFRRGQAKVLGSQQGKLNEMTFDTLRESEKQTSLMNKLLNTHQQSLHESQLPKLNQSNRIPEYLRVPEITIDTERLADVQQNVADKLGDVISYQKNIVKETKEHTPILRRMSDNQGVTNEMLANLNEEGKVQAVQAYHQRNEALSKLSDLVVSANEQNNLITFGNRQRKEVIENLDYGNILTNKSNELLGEANGNLSNINKAVTYESALTRDLLQKFLTDIGEEIVTLTHEQVLTRMGILQALYGIQSTFIQTHEAEMLSYQNQKNLLVQILDRTGLTEEEKFSRKLWEEAELLRSTGQVDSALVKLEEAHKLDNLNPQVMLSIGTIHSTLGNSDLASIALAEAEVRADIKNSHLSLSSYILMNLSNSLLLLKRYEHAEQVMWKALQKDPRNREVWFSYAKCAWKVKNKQNNALYSLRELLNLNPAYYKAQILVNFSFDELREIIFR